MARKRFDIFNSLIIVGLGGISLICIFPFYETLLLSFSSMGDASTQKVFLYPVSFDLSSYKFLISEGKATRGLFISLFVTIAGTFLNIVSTAAGAYALSKKSLPGRNIIFNFIIFTMFFSGGLIPFFLVVKSLHLQNNLLVMIVTVAINTFYLILMKNFFNTIPPDIEESAKIDGANDIVILIKIVLPVSLPILAAISLFYAVDRWNEWYYAMLFINNTKLYPLQLVLRDTIANVSMMLSSSVGATLAEKSRGVYGESLKAAMIIISAAPIFMVYPFLQKYFASGLMIGSIKG